MPALRVEVQLWVVDGQMGAFRKFEEAAMRIMTHYGGQVLEIAQNHTAADGAPHEIHVLEFPSETEFDRYRSDAELLAMADLRDTCIARTHVTAL